MPTIDDLSRVSKLLVDRDGMSPAEASDHLARHHIALVCGPEIACSSTLQAAVLTAASVGSRCFHGTVTLHVPESTKPLGLHLSWPTAKSLEKAVIEVAPGAVLDSQEISGDAWPVIFGTRPDCPKGLQMTFDGWAVGVAPVDQKLRLRERDFCVLAGVAGGALAIAELFFQCTGVAVDATYRASGLSLWRPDLSWDDPMAVGVPIEFLPAEFWLLGLGHLGQAYLWCLGMLPFSEPSAINLLLNDYDAVVAANRDTGILTGSNDLHRFKTRLAADWLEARGFRPRLVERPFDRGTTRCLGDPIADPGLALCGFDRRGPRDILDDCGFDKVIECGLGGRADNFDAMDLHVLPHPTKHSSALWPIKSEGNDQERIEQLVKNNPVYRQIAQRQHCGHVELAGLAVAVPFVGAVAGSLVIAESVRMFNGGERYASINLQLSAPKARKAVQVEGGYAAGSIPRVAFQPVFG
jgi:hypothetical protein